MPEALDLNIYTFFLMKEGWNASTYSIEKQEAEAQSRQAAVMKRERALAYAISQQVNYCSSLCFISILL